MTRRIRPDQLATLGPKVKAMAEAVTTDMVDELSAKALRQGRAKSPIRFGDLITAWRAEKAPTAPRAKGGKAAVNTAPHAAVIDAGKVKTKHGSRRAPRGISKPVGERLVERDAQRAFEKARRRAERKL